jgi:4-methylaminobutanoate oxidase (formaldehyde-forming)
MRGQAEIVIIGGGILGCSIAYHLAQMGCTDVVLVEKDQLTSGSTTHAAGLVTQFHTSPTMMQIRAYSIGLYNRLKAEANGKLDWHPVGSLRVASSRERLQALQRKVSQAKAVGLEVEIISPAGALHLYPYMTGESLYGAVYLPQDGHLDPYSVTTELARRGKGRGVTIETGVRVTGIELSPRGEVRHVKTDHGAIRTAHVVNAAGMWAPRVAAMVGAVLPTVPVNHQHLTTQPIPGHELPRETPVLRDPDNLVYIREEVRGFLVGGFERDPKAWAADGVPWEHAAQTLAPDWDQFEEVMEGAVRRIPMLASAGIVKLVHHPDAMTPDGYPCLGPVPGLRGFYVAAGMSLNGFGGGGGIGKLMAEWILEGEPSLDLHEMNVRRFGGHYADRHFAVERAREAYRYYYYLHFPNDEREWGRPLRTTPLYPRLKALGAVLGEKNGWERANYFEPGRPGRQAGAEQRSWGWGRPPYFEQVGEEHQAARERVALFDLSSFGKIEVEGPGALPMLQRLAVSDLEKPAGRVTYTQFLNKSGGIESDVTITRLAADRFLIISGTAFASNDLGWIQMHKPIDNGSVRLRDVSEELACLALWGPRARDVLQAVTSDDVSSEAFPYLTGRTIDIEGAGVWAQRISYAGELGWELYVAADEAVKAWDALMAAGRAHGIRPAGYKALDSLRLEKSYRYWSADITPSDNPYEAGLGFCVAMEKGNFIGRAALERVLADGLRQELCALTVDCAACVLYGGEAVWENGRVVGRVRSGGFGYSVQKTIAYSYLPLELSGEGTRLSVEVFGERVPAQVVPSPLYDPQGVRLRA